jgi:hypothetical protein
MTNDSMPRPIKVVNSHAFRNGIAERYHTKSGEVPPTAGVPIITIDEGNAGPRYVRSTTMHAP